MERRTCKDKQKIKMKLIEFKDARNKADELSTLTGADVGVLLISPSGKTYSYGSTSTNNIIDKFLEMKLADRQRDYADLGKSNVFEAFEDLSKQLQALKKENDRVLRYKIMHPSSDLPPDKQLQLDRLKKVAKSVVQTELLKLDLNFAPKLDEEESS
ncbi:hypothetical protein RND71_027654 [Anisodus tanguticus]|uniref:MADS-box domain-containing protein n=1 Tax=Anisodus tanguticus TaxID=243964 RepID=A0AAE1V6D5_9SOLA|nr:hypothetical protein RND71_027654 [Anisodus tanguticus]